MDEDQLRARLPAPIAARARSLKLRDAAVTIILDAAGMDAGERAALEAGAKAALSGSDGVAEVRVALMADRPPAPHGPVIVAIGSGKGGVGKSTLTTNLAVALARSGRRVGVVDADIYGPSQPMLLHTQGERPKARDNQLIPLDSPYGVKVLSVGHLVDPGKAVAWRGPMAGGALVQMMEADWSGVDLLLLDLPPGTGDVQITMIQKHKPAGAVIVSTPQDLALIDARRAAELFSQAQVPVIGLVENMAGYVCPHCGEVSDPFGRGAVEQEAQAEGLPFLGRIPLDLVIRQASDAGEPPAAGDGPQAAAFASIGARLGDWLDGKGR